MPFRRLKPALAFSETELAKLKGLQRSRTQEQRKVVRASILLDSVAGLSERAIAAKHRVNRNTVIRSVSKCLRFGLEAALNDLQRPGKPRRLTDDSIAWVRNLACQKPQQLGYAEELWTYRLLTQHIQSHAPAAGYPALQTLSRSKLHHLLTQAEIRPHKIRYYVEKRDPDFDRKMAEVLHVYKEVEIINDGLVSGTVKEASIVTVSYDEKTGIQALANTSPDLPPIPGQQPTLRRDYEYKRLGTLSLLAGIDLHSGTITESISETHKSQDFVAFLKKLDQTYPESQVIRLILDNHSAHISKETQHYLATRPQRFQFVFTPKHGSWLNLVEVFFSKLTRTLLRGIRVASKEELVNRLRQHIETLNQDPVVFRWRYKMDEVIPMA
jgi:transposase